MKYVLIGIIVLLVASGQALWAAGDAKAGKTVYDAKCKVCHGAGGEGNPAVAKTLKAEFTPLGSKEAQAKSDDEIKKQITEGNGKMKAIPGLSGKDLDNVIAFVRTLGKS
jgi:cytochrome c5